VMINKSEACRARARRTRPCSRHRSVRHHRASSGGVHKPRHRTRCR
jgi:hypothetical protein